MVNENTSIESFLVSPEESNLRIENWQRRIDECKKNGHRELVDVFGYQGKGPEVLQRCNYCRLYQERRVTGEEIRAYNQLLNTIINI